MPKLRVMLSRFLAHLPSAGRGVAIVVGIALLLSLVVGLAEGRGSGNSVSPSANVPPASATPPPVPTVVPKFQLSAATAPLPPGAPPSSDATGASSGEIMVTRSYPFAWPAIGPITSYMGSSHPLGIDIGLSYGSDSPILATASG
ncbi:MAG TPA: hypothetical protein VFY10_09275, partial [Dehalococcoidia bacterium]|nr:hypothetical protein [Dehalococcoidia bacterium]